MFVPILSTLLLLDVSVSSTSNSSIDQHEDPVVFARHLNNSLPSANSSLTVAEGKFESSDDSEQDNTDSDETDGEMRMKFLLNKWISPFSYKQLPPEEYFNSLRSTQQKASKLLLNENLSNKNLKRIFKHFKKLLQSNDEQMKSFVDEETAALLRNAATSERTQALLLKSETKLSTIFTSLMLRTKDGSLEEFFKLELHIPLLSYTIKLIGQVGFPKGRSEVADDIVRILTANHNGGNLITWLGRCQSDQDLINRVIKVLVQSATTRKLAYRLQSLRSDDFKDLFSKIEHLDEQAIRDHILDYAAYIRFNFIEHEAKSSSFVVSKFRSFLQYRYKDSEEKQKQFFSRKQKRVYPTGFALDSNRYTEIDWTQFTEDQVRLFKATLQSDDQVKSVRETLQAASQVASFTEKLGDKTMVDTFQTVLNDEKFVQWLQAVLEDEKAVQSLKTILKDAKDPEDLMLLLTKDDKLNQKEVTELDELIKSEGLLQLLQTSMVNDERMTMLKKALGFEGRLRSVDDILCSTELDTKKLLDGILSNQKITQSLKEIVKDDVRLKLFKSALEGKEEIKNFLSALGDKDLAYVLLKDMDQVFFLRVAIKDDYRTNLFRAALENKEQVKHFVEALDKKKLANVFKSILKEKNQVRLLEDAVTKQSKAGFRFSLNDRDRMMLAEEMEKNFIQVKVSDSRIN
ncbi:uncharacterized protein PHALS_11932 [Plasmopara halstedii]|uniref:RxLR-like protein n=1 Tax=Plasmopara halstedii TaxID=4781 RepID=A0A0P1ALJ5_PLAHL|nr:uncharacterized protein PHALS_11932 [Plasmopara halstedii]CEG41597.1 hypothetical protein PHALS_11932 [Plasmopara halstedii]|eukprot:XP_024577966.1 hypothetical protein PHALS_11932 [Plasmopara halstedii]